MADNVVDQIVDALLASGLQYFPQHSQLRAVRVVGHTPKSEHYTYEIVLDFPDGGERLSAKIYRPSKCGVQAAFDMAKNEYRNLSLAYRATEAHGLQGIPRPVGDFTSLGAVVCTKISGLPLQSLIMKAALLPDSGHHGLLEQSAGLAGDWLRRYHEATAEMPFLLDSKALLSDLEKLCGKAKSEGLASDSIAAILDHAKSALNQFKKPLASSKVLNDFVPLNVYMTETGVGFCDFANLSERGYSLSDAAIFLAAVEALEKYPFCGRAITTPVQDAFLQAYGVNADEMQLLTVLKVKALLQMFANGRVTKESAVRKRTMWANVMKRFIQQAAERSMAPAA